MAWHGPAQPNMPRSGVSCPGRQPKLAGQPSPTQIVSSLAQHGARDGSAGMANDAGGGGGGHARRRPMVVTDSRRGNQGQQRRLSPQRPIMPRLAQHSPKGRCAIPGSVVQPTDRHNMTRLVCQASRDESNGTMPLLCQSTHLAASSCS